MRKVLSIFIFALLLNVSSIYAQENLKIGHVNIPEIVQKLPESDSIQSVLKKEADDMEKMFQEMLNEHEKSLSKYETEKATYSEFVRNSKEKELMEMSGKIQQFQQTANQQLQKRNIELFQPLYTKINDAISKVAMKENYTYILDLSNGTVAYHSPFSNDLNSTVLKELGVVSER